MKVVDIPKIPTWVDHVTDLEIGSELPASYDKANYLRNIISNRIAFKFPEREYETKTITEKDKKYIVVRRIR